MSESLGTLASRSEDRWDAPLAPVPTILARARSRVLHAAASRLLPRSVLVSRGERGTRRKSIALTFDDGPDAMTRQYLDLLDELGVKATFFVLGKNAADAPTLTEEYVRRGHEVGGHGWSHQPFPAMTQACLLEELARMRAALPARSVLPSRPLMVRPPRGSLSPRTLLRVARAGYTTVLWSVDSDDCRTRDPQVVVRRLDPRRVESGDIVLLHEMQPWTLQALPMVVRGMQSAGYALVTVGELLQDDDDGLA
jgi:peptidoglycan-N-acetylglucosamine deacetylase